MGIEEQSAGRKEFLQGIQNDVERAGMERRDHPDFSLLAFVKEMVERYGNEPVPLFYGLNTVARDWFDGYSPELLATIANAFGITSQTEHSEILQKMMPFLAIGGRSLARDYLAQIGFTRAEIGQYKEEAERAHGVAFRAGELVFK